VHQLIAELHTAAARGIPAQANVIGSSMFFIALFVVVIGQVLGSKRKSRV
jgi:spermidine/putrescine transport system permease protein